jgi:hypothetical protein
VCTVCNNVPCVHPSHTLPTSHHTLPPLTHPSHLPPHPSHLPPHPSSTHTPFTHSHTLHTLIALHPAHPSFTHPSHPSPTHRPPPFTHSSHTLHTLHTLIALHPSPTPRVQMSNSLSAAFGALPERLVILQDGKVRSADYTILAGDTAGWQGEEGGSTIGYFSHWILPTCHTPHAMHYIHSRAHAQNS